MSSCQPTWFLTRGALAGICQVCLYITSHNVVTIVVVLPVLVLVVVVVVLSDGQERCACYVVQSRWLEFSFLWMLKYG